MKNEQEMKKTKIYCKDLFGLRELKYTTLNESSLSSTLWTELEPKTPFYLFIKRDTTLEEEYEKGWRVTEILIKNVLGFQTHRDDFVIDFEMDNLKRRINDFLDGNKSDDEVRMKYLRANDKLDVNSVRKSIRASKDYQNSFVQVLYRPFDIRNLFYKIGRASCRERVCLYV